MAAKALRDPRLVARAGVALVLANARYWTSVAPAVRKELARWAQHARAIDDPELRALALAKLHGEGFHAEAAAMLATSVPRAHRRTVVEAIVALEVLFDYLDGLTERPSRDPLRDGERLFGAFIAAVAVTSPDAVTFPSAAAGEPVERPPCDDGGYLQALSGAVSVALARLPAAVAVTGLAQRIASRSGEAQTRMHAASALGTAQLEHWGRAQAEGTGLEWRELVVGAASSVLVLHALIAAAGNPRTTTQEAALIEDAYLSTCALLTLLDGLVDHEHDTAHVGYGRPGYLSLFEARDELPEVLGQAARRAAAQARALPGGAHHVMLLTGVVAYYSSAPGARSAPARPVVARLRRELEPLISPTLGIMRAWRATRRRARLLRAKGRGESYHETSVEEGTVRSPRCCG
jgi:tetraprenyl-beta-curcumene synthase